MGAPQYEQAGADIGGTGTTNTIPRWTGASTLGDSVITQNSTALVTAGSASATQTTFRVYTVGTANNAPASSWYRGGVAEFIQYINSAGALAFAANPAGFTDAQLDAAAKVWMTFGGNVGIGTATPLSYANYVSLTIGGNDAAKTGILKFRSTYNGGNGAEIFQSTAGVLAISANGSRSIMSAQNTGATDSAAQVAIGTSSFTSGRALTTVADLDVFGVRIGRGNNGIASNTAIGSGTLAAVSTAPNATAVGVNALAALTTGTNNTAIGLSAAAAATTSYNNTVVGVSALGTMTTNAGYQNVAVGVSALGAATSAKNNVAIGMSAGAALTSGSSNIIIGSGADVAATTDSNKLVIGDATNYVATNGGATTYYATAGALAGYIIVRLNGTDVKLPVYAL